MDECFNRMSFTLNMIFAMKSFAQPIHYEKMLVHWIIN
jgi:hypothetical protein